MHKCGPRAFRGCTCGCHRYFYTKEEKVEQLETYKMQLEKEIEGVEAEIERLQQ